MRYKTKFDLINIKNQLKKILLLEFEPNTLFIDFEHIKYQTKFIKFILMIK